MMPRAENIASPPPPLFFCSADKDTTLLRPGIVYDWSEEDAKASESCHSP